MAKHSSHIVLLTLAVSITASLAAPFRIAARSRDIQERDQTLEELYARNVDGHASLFKRSKKGRRKDLQVLVPENRLSTIPEDGPPQSVIILPKGRPFQGRPSSPPPKMRKTEGIPDVPPLPAQFQAQDNNAKPPPVIQLGTSNQPIPRPDSAKTEQPPRARRPRLVSPPPTPPPTGGLPPIPLITRKGHQVPANSPYSPPDSRLPAPPRSKSWYPDEDPQPPEPVQKPTRLQKLFTKSTPNLKGSKSPTSPPNSPPTSPKSATSSRSKKSALGTIFRTPGKIREKDMRTRDVYDDEEFFVRAVHDEDEDMFSRDEKELFPREFDLDELD